MNLLGCMRFVQCLPVSRLAVHNSIHPVAICITDVYNINYSSYSGMGPTMAVVIILILSPFGRALKRESTLLLFLCEILKVELRPVQRITGYRCSLNELMDFQIEK